MRIFEVCERLHMAVTGAGDPIGPDEAGRLIEFLDARLANWRPSLKSDSSYSAHYDAAVLNLVMATLSEARKESSWNPGTDA